MDKKVRIQFASYIRTNLVNREILNDLFSTNTPTENDIQRQIDKNSNQINAEPVSAKAIQKLLNNQSSEPREETLNYTAELFNVDPCDIDEFNNRLRKGEFQDKDFTPNIITRNEELFYYEKLKLYIEEYNDLLKNKIRNFVGRKFIFNEIDHFVDSHDWGYFFVVGKPGIGKTSFASKLVSDRQYLFHIINANNIGLNSTRDFISNICSQLIVKYKLPYDELPEKHGNNGAFLYKLLKTVSSKLGYNEKVIIVVDGIDELGDLTFFKESNILYLPDYLPNNIFFILTMRDIEDQIKLPQKENCEIFQIDHESEDNLNDIKEYIKNSMKDNKMKQYLNTQNIKDEDFIRVLEGKSEGNFMYLRYVLDEISKGIYQDKTINELPNGLEGYYKDHFERMLSIPSQCIQTKLKVIYVLSDMNSPISLEFLSNICQIDPILTQEILIDWKQFLNIDKEEQTTNYSFYHKSFIDFLKNKEIVKAAGIDLKDIKGAILDYYTQGLNI